MIGFISLAVTAGGLWFIWKQLRVTEVSARAAQQAAQIAHNAERAWLKLGGSRGEIRWSGEFWIGHFQLRIHNVGRSPALAVHIIVSRDGSHGPPPPGSMGLTAWTIWPGDERRVEQHIVLHEPLESAVWVVCVMATYRLGDSTIWHQTPLWLQLSRPQVDDPGHHTRYVLNVEEWDHQLYRPT